MARRVKAAQQPVAECRRKVIVEVRDGTQPGYYEGVGSARCENCPRGFKEKTLFMTRSHNQAERIAERTENQIDTDMGNGCQRTNSVP